MSDDLTRVRRMIGDTNSSDQLLDDSDLQDYLDDFGNIFAAAAAACDDLAAMMAREVDQSITGMSLKSGDMFTHYEKLAVNLRKRALRAGYVTVKAGGIKKADADANRQDDTIVQPIFRRDLHNIPVSTVPPILVDDLTQRFR